MHPQNSSKFPKYANPAISEPRTTLHPITTGGIFSLKFLMLKIRLNILITNRLRLIWLQRDGSFATKKSLSADLGLRSPTHLLYICGMTKWTARCARFGTKIGGQFGGQRGGIKPWALAGV